MSYGETLIDKGEQERAIADCETFYDDNGELQTSSDTPDRIGEPIPPKPRCPKPTPGDIYEEF